MWRQVPSSIHTVMPASASTSQNRALLMRPMEVRQPWPRSTRPLQRRRHRHVMAARARRSSLARHGRDSAADDLVARIQQRRPL
jgi:hypothetical protein